MNGLDRMALVRGQSVQIRSGQWQQPRKKPGHMPAQRLGDIGSHDRTDRYKDPGRGPRRQHIGQRHFRHGHWRYTLQPSPRCAPPSSDPPPRWQSNPLTRHRGYWGRAMRRLQHPIRHDRRTRNGKVMAVGKRHVGAPGEDVPSKLNPRAYAVNQPGSPLLGPAWFILLSAKEHAHDTNRSPARRVLRLSGSDRLSFCKAWSPRTSSPAGSHSRS